MDHRLTATACLAVWCALLAGCDTNKPYPDRDFFMIELGAPPAATKGDSEVALRVRELLVASPYGDRAFVYKVGDKNFETDYYNGFIAPPGELLTAELVKWLSESGLFGSVAAPGSGADHDFVLEGMVTELYGDYSTPDAPVAVIAVRWYLLDDRGARTDIIYTKMLRAVAPLEGPAPENLPTAWGRAYGDVLGQLTADLSRLSLTHQLPAKDQERGGGTR